MQYGLSQDGQTIKSEAYSAQHEGDRERSASLRYDRNVTKADRSYCLHRKIYRLEPAEPFDKMKPDSTNGYDQRDK